MLIVSMKNNFVLNLKHISRIYTSKDGVLMKFDDGSITGIPCGQDKHITSSLITYIVQCYAEKRQICDVDNFVQKGR